MPEYDPWSSSYPRPSSIISFGSSLHHTGHPRVSLLFCGLCKCSNTTAAINTDCILPGVVLGTKLMYSSTSLDWCAYKFEQLRVLTSKRVAVVTLEYIAICTMRWDKFGFCTWSCTSSDQCLGCVFSSKFFVQDVVVGFMLFLIDFSCGTAANSGATLQREVYTTNIHFWWLWKFEVTLCSPATNFQDTYQTSNTKGAQIR